MAKSGTEQRRAEAAEREAVLLRCWEEFHRLNAVYFDGKLALKEIRLSARKQYGGYYRPSQSLIVLSWQAYREYGWPETLETLRHETAHIVHPNHSPAFWELARRLGCTRRYASTPKAPGRHYTRYTYQCPACGLLYHKNRRLKDSSCGKCDRQYNPKYVLKLVSSAAARRAGRDA